MSLLAYGLVVLAILGSLAGLYGTIHHSGVNEGRAEVQARWDKASKAAQERRDANRVVAQNTASKSASDLAAAQQKGAEYAALWRASRNRKPESSLAGCSGAPTANATGTAGTQPSTPAVRFSLGFLRDWNGAWTGAAGQPVLPDSPPLALKSADTLTSIGAGAVLDNQAANAEACSKDRRSLDSLIDQIEKLRAGWR